MIRDYINLLLKDPGNDKICLQNAYTLVDKIYNDVNILKVKFTFSEFLSKLDKVPANTFEVNQLSKVKTYVKLIFSNTI